MKERSTYVKKEVNLATLLSDTVCCAGRFPIFYVSLRA